MNVNHITTQKLIKQPRLSFDRLREVIQYEPLTGVFLWKSSKKSTYILRVAGCLNYYGYRVIRIDQTNYTAHRLAWLYTYGKWPDVEIDHINLVKDDNRIYNLREATRSQNQRNTRKLCGNTSGFKGISWNNNAGKWQVYIRTNSKRIHLGYFFSLSDAADAYSTASSKYHGEFGRVA